MRFAMVTTFYPPYSFGGDATFVHGLSRALAERGHSVDVIHCGDAFRLLSGEPSAAATDDPGVTVHRLESPFGPLSPIMTQQTSQPGLKEEQLRELLARDFDVVHFHNISLVGGLGVLGLSSAPCTLYTLHEHWLLCATHVFWKNRSKQCDRPTCFTCCLRSGTPPQLWRYTGMRVKSLRHVDQLIAPSRYTADRHKAGGVTQPISVLPHFSAIETTAPGPRPALPDPYFLYVGRMTKSKGVETLAAAFAGSPEHCLVLAGAGELYAPLTQKHAQHSNLRFIGPVPQPELATLYAHARAVILPSLAPETFGLTVVEAACFNTPALVRRSAGGAVELIEESEAGFVYDDEEDLLRKVRLLANDEELARQLGEHSGAAYMRRFTLGKHLAGYFQCIDVALKQKRGR